MVRMPFGSQDNLQCRAAFVQRTKTFSLEQWTDRKTGLKSSSQMQGSSPSQKTPVTSTLNSHYSFTSFENEDLLYSQV